MEAESFTDKSGTKPGLYQSRTEPYVSLGFFLVDTTAVGRACNCQLTGFIIQAGIDKRKSRDNVLVIV